MDYGLWLGWCLGRGLGGSRESKFFVRVKDIFIGLVLRPGSGSEGLSFVRVKGSFIGLVLRSGSGSEGLSFVRVKGSFMMRSRTVEIDARSTLGGVLEHVLGTPVARVHILDEPG